MIQKITSEQYLKRYDNMTGDEKAKVMERVGDWLKTSAPLLLQQADRQEAHLQSVMQVSLQWNDAVSNGWTEGVKLLTAFAGMTDTWLPDRLYIKAARRSIRQVVEVLKEYYKPTEPIKPTMPNKPTEPVSPPEQKRKRGRPRKTEQPQATADVKPQTSQTTQTPQANNVAQNANKAAVDNNVAIAKTVIPRPQHIDQYAYLLPEDTQKRAAQYGQLMRDLGTSRENMRLLMNDPQSNALERQKWARVSVKLDEQIAGIRRELDDEWQKLVAKGNVALDAFGIAHIVDPKTGEYKDPKPKVQIPKDEKPKEEKPKRSHHKQLTDEEKAKRISYLQKWLRDARPANTLEHRKQWEQNARELVRLGGNVTDSIVKAGEHYGAKVPKPKQQ